MKKKEKEVHLLPSHPISESQLFPFCTLLGLYMKWEILSICASLRQPATLAGSHGSIAIVEWQEDDRLHAFTIF